MVFFLRVAPEVAARRRCRDAREEELFDRIETQRRVAAGYEEVIAARRAFENIHIVDGHQAPDAITRELTRLVGEVCERSTKTLHRP